MSYSCLNVELLEIMEQGRMWPSLKMVTLNHIKHKPVGSNTSLLIQKWESIPTCKTKDEDDKEAVDWGTSGVLTPMASLLPSISRTGRDTTISRLPVTWMSLNPILQVRPLSQRGTTRLWHRYLLLIEMEPHYLLCFFHLSWGKRLRQTWRIVAKPVPETSLYGHTGKPH